MSFKEEDFENENHLYQYSEDVSPFEIDRNLSDVPVSQRPTLRQGDTGQWVYELQRELKQLTYYNGPINGNFDAATNTAVRNFQAANRLTVDGIVGRSTWSALIYLYAPLTVCGGSGHMPVPFEGLVIDPGHGGTDSGAVGNDIIEKDMNLAISMYQKDRFLELNVPVYLTRTSDETLTNAERVSRVKSAFGSGRGVVLISNHINAGGGEGAEVIYALRNTAVFPTMILNEINLAGQVVRRVYQRPSTTDPNVDYYYILRDTAAIQAVIVEYGFLDNVADAERLRFNWMRYAEAVVKATCEYIGYAYRPPYSDEIVYVVQPGDTLFNIAQRFQTTVNAIMSLNNLTSTEIRVGQQLKIPFFTPEPPPQTTTHTVVAGDTLFSIAQRFNTTVGEIMRLNNMTSTNITVGQVLIVPITIAPPEPPPIPEIRPTLRQGDRGESVRELQTMLNALGFSVGAVDGVFGNATYLAVRNFQAANGLTVDGIVGPSTWTALDNAMIAPPPGETFVYTVVAGDSLFRIAQRFNTTVDEIMRLNNLTTTALSIGQQLLIPVSGSTFIYTVVAGDSLFRIAQRFNTTVDEIMRLNNLTSTALSIGQQLIIPSGNREFFDDGETTVLTIGPDHLIDSETKKES